MAAAAWLDLKARPFRLTTENLKVSFEFNFDADHCKTM